MTDTSLKVSKLELFSKVNSMFQNPKHDCLKEENSMRSWVCITHLFNKTVIFIIWSPINISKYADYVIQTQMMF